MYFEGNVQGDHDPERMFAGDSIDIKVEVRMQMLGRRLIGAPAVRILDAEVDWSWTVGSSLDEEEGGDVPQFSFAEALAQELRIPLDEAQALDDAEIPSTRQTLVSILDTWLMYGIAPVGI